MTGRSITQALLIGATLLAGCGTEGSVPNDTSRPPITSGDVTTTLSPQTTLPVTIGERRDLAAVASSFSFADGRVLETVTVDGDYLMTDADSGETVVVYDAVDLRFWMRVGDGAVRREGFLSFDDPFLRDQTAVQGMVASAREAGTLEVVDVGGRPAGRVTYRDEYTFDQWQIVTEYTMAVDLETGLLVVYEANQVSPPIDPDDLPRTATAGTATVGLRAEAELFAPRSEAAAVFDDGFAALSSLDELARLVPYELLVPTWLPDGFRLTQIAYGDQPAGRSDRIQMAVLTYRNWAWRIDVTIRSGESVTPDGEWRNPLDPEQRFMPTERVDGFEIYAADLFIPPHAWAVVGDTVVTISGGVGPEAIADIVRSLQAYGR